MRFTLFVILLLICCSQFPARAQSPQKPLMIGFLHQEAKQYETEWRLYTGYYPALVAGGLQGALVEKHLIYSGKLTPGALYQQLKPFHAIVLVTTEEGVDQMTADDRARALVARDDLVRYVQEGGGLYLQAQSVRYPGDDDEKFHNILLEPFGAQMMNEGIFDKSHTFDSPRTLVFPPMRFFTTKNIKPHSVTQNVRGLALPLYASERIPGVQALKLDENWKVVISAESSAKSYAVNPDNSINLERDGTYQNAPPIAAVREFGKGRVFIYAAPEKHTFLNYKNRMWPQITESDGDVAGGQPSDSNTLIINALRWLAENARQNPELGTHQLAPIEPVKFESAINWDASTFSAPSPGVRGFIGAHSNYSDGQGSVADYVKAARAAGLSFIGFTDPLELLTQEKFEKLKADCAAASTTDFVVVPGVEFTDSLGVRWAVWGERVVWPESSFTDKSKSFPVWDGKQMFATGRYAAMCGYAANAIVDYRALHAANAHPANLWWFSRIFPFSYEIGDSGAKLLADNFDEYLYALRDLRYIAVDAFTRVRSPQQVAIAARTCTTSVRDIAAARELLSARLTTLYPSANAIQQVSQGPRILQWATINNQMENPWLITRGAQRVRLRFEVSSDAGIKEVKVHDANFGLVRRFAGNGVKVLARDWEMVHDKQHYLVLEVIDTNGKRAVSPYQFIFCYKSGLYRCGDNLNTLGSAQLIWHPDRNQMPSMVKYFENGFKYTVKGIDSGPPIATQPSFWPLDAIRTPEGNYPAREAGIPNKIPDVLLGSYNLQIYRTEIAQLSEGFDTDKRPTPALGPIARRVGPLELFERTHTTYAPASREDYFITWNYRRPYEGSKDYRGSILWHEGEVRFKKDVTLKGAVPVPFFYTTGPGGAKFNLYDHFYVTDREKGLVAVQLQPDQKERFYQTGNIRPGGYCAVMNTDLGYFGFFASSDSEFTYACANVAENPSLFGQTLIGMGHDGQQVKAGTIWKYRFATATIADEKTDNALLEDTAKALNFDGGTTGYPHQISTGKLVNAEYFFTVDAQNHEAEFSLGPRDLIIDLPIRVRGIEDNGCAAVFAKNRGFFRFISVVDSTAYFQEAIDKQNSMWVGNVFVCDDKNIKMTFIEDGQAANKPPRLEIHNPTDKVLATRIYSPPHTPQFGGLSVNVTVPAGTSVFYAMRNKKLLPE